MAPKLTELSHEQTRASKMEKDIMLAQLDQQFVAALPERPPVTHHCHIVETGNESYRFRNSSTQSNKEVKQRKFKQEP